MRPRNGRSDFFYLHFYHFYHAVAGRRIVAVVLVDDDTETTNQLYQDHYNTGQQANMYALRPLGFRALLCPSCVLATSARREGVQRGVGGVRSASRATRQLTRSHQRPTAMRNRLCAISNVQYKRMGLFFIMAAAQRGHGNFSEHFYEPFFILEIKELVQCSV